MKIAIVAPYGANKYHFETDLELAQKHLSNGDDVTLLTCAADLLSCYVNIDHHVDQCLNCILRRRRSVRTLSGPIKCIPLVSLNAGDHRALGAIPSSFSDLDDLRAFRFGSFDLGIAVVSSIVSFLRDPEPSVVDESVRIHRLNMSAAAIYLSMTHHLTTGGYDRVYAFNGRFATLRAVLRASQEAGVDCYLHDRGSSIDRYALFANDLPHSIQVMEERIRSAWEQAGATIDRIDVASQFFEDRRRGEIRNWYSFTDAQEKDLLPQNWASDRYNIVVFPSSDDEFVAIGDEWRNPLYSSQEEGLLRVAEDLRGVDGADLHIRMHPNLRGLSFGSIDRLKSLEGENIHIIAPESPVGSYSMLLAADAVLTFGSTMGIEATYWGKPSLLAGKCFYRGLGATTNPEDHSTLVDLLLHPPRPLDKTGALMYGYFQSTFGEPFRYFQPESLTDGLFRDLRVDPGPIGYRLLKLLNSSLFVFPRGLLARAFEARAKRKILGPGRTPPS